MRKILDYLVREISLGGFAIKLWILLAVAIVLCLLIIYIICISIKSQKEKRLQEEKRQEACQYMASEQLAPKKIVSDKKVEEPQAKKVPYESPTVTSQEKPESQPQELAQEVLADEQEEQTATGRFEITLRADGYRFTLLSSDNRVLYESAGYTTPNGSIRGIDTFKNAVQSEDFVIEKDKLGRYKYSINRRYIGNNCDTEEQCKQDINLIKNLGPNAITIDYQKDEEAEKAYSQSKFSKRVDIVTLPELKEKAKGVSPNGQFGISKTASGHYFYLIDAEENYLYFSLPYASITTAKNNINTFRRTAYSGAFAIEEDYQGRFRFVLKGGTNSYFGEYYPTEEECQQSVNAIKQLSLSASLPT